MSSRIDYERILKEKKEEMTYKELIERKKEFNEQIRKLTLFGGFNPHTQREEKGIFEILIGRKIAMSEYILYLERFEYAKSKGEIYNIKDFIRDIRNEN
jgi:hypothetical protein